MLELYQIKWGFKVYYTYSEICMGECLIIGEGRVVFVGGQGMVPQWLGRTNFSSILYKSPTALQHKYHPEGGLDDVHLEKCGSAQDVGGRTPGTPSNSST